MRKTQTLLFIVILAAVVIAAGAFLTWKPGTQTNAAFLEKYGFSGLSVEQIVEKLDASTADPVGLKASITSEYLVLKDDSTEISLALPKDKFYLSFAPYVQQTHPCETHSLSSCQGELVNQEIHAVVSDNAGKEVLASDMTTMENGFVGVWLPRNMQGTVTVSYNGLVAQAPITTFMGSNTCLTTPLQLN